MQATAIAPIFSSGAREDGLKARGKISYHWFSSRRYSSPLPLLSLELFVGSITHWGPLRRHVFQRGRPCSLLLYALHPAFERDLSCGVGKHWDNRNIYADRDTMEPVSAVASIATVVDLALRTTSSLIKYARDTQHASTDRKLLAEEAQVLSKLLQRLRDRARAVDRDEKWVAEHSDVVRQFEAAYDDLALSLRLDPSTGHAKEESRFKAIRTASRWSFTKFQVYSLLERVTRLQQYANTLLSDDQLSGLPPASYTLH